MPHVPAKLNSAQVAICATYFSDKAILTPKNYRAHEVNKAVLKRLRGQEYVCRSVDNTADDDNTNAKFPVEFLNSLNLSGLPDHELHLKVGCVVMVLRNISPSIGLCNGTRVLLTIIKPRCLHGLIIAGEHSGTPVNIYFNIPRITLLYSLSPSKHHAHPLSYDVCFSSLKVNSTFLQTNTCSVATFCLGFLHTAARRASYCITKRQRYNFSSETNCEM